MSGELLRRIKELQKLVIDRSNTEFKKNAIEQINPDKVDEDILPAVVEPETEVAVVEDDIEDLADVVANQMKLEEMIRKSISEEEEATVNYIKRARKCMKHHESPMEALFRELAEDEIVHAAALREALATFVGINRTLELKGAAEFQSITGVSEASIEDEEAKLINEVEKERKEFDFVKEYTKNKAEYNKTVVVGAINDLIAGKADLAGTVEKIIKDGKKLAGPSKEEKKGTEKKAKENKKSDKKDK